MYDPCRPRTREFSLGNGFILKDSRGNIFWMVKLTWLYLWNLTVWIAKRARNLNIGTFYKRNDGDDDDDDDGDYQPVTSKLKPESLVWYKSWALHTLVTFGTNPYIYPKKVLLSRWFSFSWGGICGRSLEGTIFCDMRIHLWYIYLHLPKESTNMSVNSSQSHPMY